MESSAQESHEVVGVGSKKSTKIIQRLGQLCCEDRLKKMGLFSSWKRKTQGDSVVAFRYLKRAYRDKIQPKPNFPQFQTILPCPMARNPYEMSLSNFPVGSFQVL